MYPVEKINLLKDMLVQHHETIAVAESVTAGHVQAALSQATGAAQFFQGGITAYNLGQKARHLFVEPIEAEACNSVSPAVAAQMALQVARNFSASYGLGITGYAAKMPEKHIDTVFAFYAIACNDQVIKAGRITVGEQEGMEVQLYYTEHLLDALLECCQHTYTSR
ncbi:CinA family protein [Chitinophaga parva]|nr:CinA family protein [Chitinophaga parva]